MNNNAPMRTFFLIILVTCLMGLGFLSVSFGNPICKYCNIRYADKCNNLYCVQQNLVHELKCPESNSLFSSADIFSEQEFIFRKIRDDNSLLHLGTPEDSVLQLFFDSIKSTNTGKIAAVEEALSNNQIKINTNGYDNGIYIIALYSNDQLIGSKSLLC